MVERSDESSEGAVLVDEGFECVRAVQLKPPLISPIFIHARTESKLLFSPGEVAARRDRPHAGEVLLPSRVGFGPRSLGRIEGRGEKLSCLLVRPRRSTRYQVLRSPLPSLRPRVRRSTQDRGFEAKVPVRRGTKKPPTRVSRIPSYLVSAVRQPLHSAGP